MFLKNVITETSVDGTVEEAAGRIHFGEVFASFNEFELCLDCWCVVNMRASHKFKRNPDCRVRICKYGLPARKKGVGKSCEWTPSEPSGSSQGLEPPDVLGVRSFNDFAARRNTPAFPRVRPDRPDLNLEEQVFSQCTQRKKKRVGVKGGCGEKNRYDATQMTEFRRQYTRDVEYMPMFRMRSICQDIISGCEQQSFSQIPSLCARISEVDPSAVVDWYRFDGTCVFMRAFVCPSACRNVLRYCQKIVALDACFTKNKKYPTQLFIASTVDGNSQVLPLAYAVAPTENYENWKWFIQNLMASMEGLESPNLIIVSNRQKGLEKAVAEVLPRNFHMHCAHHLKMNVQKHFGTAAGKAFLTLVYMNDQARYARTTSNIMECINGALKPVRDYAPCHIIWQMWNYMLNLFYARREMARISSNELTEFATSRMTEIVKNFGSFVAMSADENEALVQTDGGRNKTIPVILQTELPMSVACRAPPAAIRNGRQRIVRIPNGGSVRSAESEYSYPIEDDPAMNPAAVMTNVSQEDAVERGNPLVQQSSVP
ncbi:hypothetical protein R1sor_017764 [Riccia sorocarpa]|uniref:MULE transposase domain-containing protein n=1 Tax=Riccia sorocarpa TaxID=122646 RepID=A0ABD3IAK0_9MARC